MINNISKLKKIIDTAIAALPVDWKIGQSLWIYKSKKRCCPLGSIIIFHHGIKTDPLESINHMKQIGLDEDKSYAFAHGFDGTIPDNNRDLDFYELGRLYRDKYIV